MANLNINIPDDYLTEIKEISELLQMSIEETVQLALSYFMQFESIDNAAVAMQRYLDKSTELTTLPTLEEEFNLNINFHPEALIEFQELEPDDQAQLILELADRISNAEESEDTLDLVLRENEDAQLVLSCFDFGDIIYEISDSLTIYLINTPELYDTEEFEIDEDELEEYDEDEDDEYDDEEYDEDEDEYEDDEYMMDDDELEEEHQSRPFN